MIYYVEIMRQPTAMSGNFDKYFKRLKECPKAHPR